MVSDVLKMPFAMRGVMMRERDVRVALPAAGLGFRSSQLDSHLRIPLSIGKSHANAVSADAQ
jgi:hypothetical protein